MLSIKLSNNCSYKEHYHNKQIKLIVVNNHGKKFYSNGELEYEGDFNNLEFHGKGKQYYMNMLKYEGDFKDGYYHGKGKYYFQLTNYIIGNFKYGKMNGYCEYYCNNKLNYKGDMIDKEYNGQGILYTGYYDFVGGIVIEMNERIIQYDGEFKDSEYHGFGKKYEYNSRKNCNELKYEGEFKKDEYSGKGTKYSRSGKILYIGEFDKGEYNGIGKLYSETNGNLLYEGGFKNGYYQGEGRSYDSDNELLEYEGSFEQGSQHGKCKLYHVQDGISILLYDGEINNSHYWGKHGKGKLYQIHNKRSSLLYDGQFKKDNYEGYGKLYHENGNILCEGNFKDGDIEQENVKMYYDNNELFREGSVIDSKFTGIEYYYIDDKLYKHYYFDNKLDTLKTRKLINNPDYIDIRQNFIEKQLRHLPAIGEQLRGIFIDGKLEGFGEHRCGVDFIGEFERGLRKKGIEYHSNGKKKFEGTYNIELYNNGILYDENENIIYKGEFINGQYNTKNLLINQIQSIIDKESEKIGDNSYLEISNKLHELYKIENGADDY